jgi:hypothetical protein
MKGLRFKEERLMTLVGVIAEELEIDIRGEILGERHERVGLAPC